MLVSVVIATYNRHAELEKVLKDFLNQELLGFFDYEIIVADNNSTDQTEATVNHLIPQFNGRLTYLKQAVRGKSNALNMAIKQAKGEIIAFTDDDVIVERNWLSSLVECFNQYDCEGVGGRVLPVYPDNTPGWVSQHPVQLAGVVVIYDQGEKARLADETIERFIGSNWAFKSSIFKECGLFRIDLGPGTPMIVGEDEEFYLRLLEKKKKLYYCPQVIIHHPVDLRRLSLRNAAIWHMALGRYQAFKQIEQGREKFIYYCGVPRYLIKNIVINSLKLLIFWVNPFAFWNAYRSLFCNIGMIQQYQILTRGEINAKS